MKQGSFYVEVMVALSMVGIIATSFMPLLPQLLQQTQQMTRYSRLESISEYCGSYLFRWVDLSRSSKLVPFAFFRDDDELEITGEHRVNHLLWAVPPQLTTTYLTDHYKVSLVFKDTIARTNSAGIILTTWYDNDLNDVLDEGELSMSFSTIISEKMP